MGVWLNCKARHIQHTRQLAWPNTDHGLEVVDILLGQVPKLHLREVLTVASVGDRGGCDEEVHKGS